MPPAHVSSVSPSSRRTQELKRPSRLSHPIKLSTGWFMGLACSRSFLAPEGQMTYATVVHTYSAFLTMPLFLPGIGLRCLKLPSRKPDQPKYSMSASLF